MVCKAAVDTMLDGDSTQVAGFSARFAGVVFPGENLSIRIWKGEGQLLISAFVAERDAPALADVVLTLA
jgi:hypothetical protein